MSRSTTGPSSGELSKINGGGTAGAAGAFIDFTAFIAFITFLAFGAGAAAGAFIDFAAFIAFIAVIDFIGIVLIYCYSNRGAGNRGAQAKTSTEVVCCTHLYLH